MEQEKQPLDNFRNCITKEEADTMHAFTAPMLQTLKAEIALDDDSVAGIELNTSEFVLGMQLYSRLMSNYAGLVAIRELIRPLSTFLTMLDDGDEESAIGYILDQKDELYRLVIQRFRDCEDNISITEEHIRQFCKENDVPIIKTPYSQ